MKSLATNYRTKLFQDIQKMNQTRDPIADHIAGTSTITSSLHVKSLSQICCTARASAAKVVVDQQRKWVHFKLLRRMRIFRGMQKQKHVV